MVAESENEAMAIVTDLLAGTVGGCGGIIAGQPLDTVKVRLQSPRTRHLYTGVLNCFSKVVRQEGFLALFKGISSPLVGNAPMQAIVFGMNGNANRLMDKHVPYLRKTSSSDDFTKKPNFLRMYLAGTWAGVGQLSVCVPVELVKCKLQVQQDANIKLYSGPLDCVKKVFRKQGIFGFYRGFWPTFWRDGPTYGLYFVVYESIKWKAMDKTNGSNSVPSLLFAGGCAGICTWLFTYPFDVVKSIIQTLPDDAPREHRSMRYQFATNYRAHGHQFFTQGLTACLVRAVPANAATFLLYEYTLNLLKAI
mmetsp:Transcript_17705/g.24760  ORF Transcript_17705/g.24760 Transcript_17705/m.24760 type:complete len:307 (+) Transcript_17705:213-1133(+)